MAWSSLGKMYGNMSGVIFPMRTSQKVSEASREGHTDSLILSTISARVSTENR